MCCRVRDPEGKLYSYGGAAGLIGSALQTLRTHNQAVMALVCSEESLTTLQMGLGVVNP